MTGVAENYAQALYDITKEENSADTVLQELMMLDAVFAETPEFLRLLATPNLAKDERIGIIDDSFRKRVHPYVLNFLKLLTQKGYIRVFSDCVRAYRQQYHADNGIISVSAVTAVALTDAQREKLQHKLETVTRKKIELICRVDPACIGGIRLDYDGKRVDGTIKNRLEAMGERLKNTVL